MEITPEFFINFIRYCVIAISVSMVCVSILGAIAVRKVGAEAITPVFQLIVKGDALRMLTVIFIVSATTGLAVLGKIEGESVATILSGVAGYVLGSGNSAKNKPETNSTSE